MNNPIVERAKSEPVIDIGQLSKTEKASLERAFRIGQISKGWGGPYPLEKIVYAPLGFDFVADRERSLNRLSMAARLDALRTAS